MPSPKKAVEVAKDVLKQLRKRKNGIVADPYGYIYTKAEFTDEELERDLQEFLDRIQGAGCHVCAVGAAVLSKARLFDEVSVKDALHRGNTDELLFDIFDTNTVALMECAFEVSDSFGTGQKEAVLQKAVAFGRQFKDPKRRLREIMENIIVHKGKFKPKPSAST